MKVGSAATGSAPPTPRSARALCGLGVLVAAGSAVWVKGCHGLTGVQATALTVDESAMALALFTGLHGIDPFGSATSPSR